VAVAAEWHLVLVVVSYGGGGTGPNLALVDEIGGPGAGTVSGNADRDGVG
jgi:hypothetical protein